MPALSASHRTGAEAPWAMVRSTGAALLAAAGSSNDILRRWRLLRRLPTVWRFYQGKRIRQAGFVQAALMLLPCRLPCCCCCCCCCFATLSLNENQRGMPFVHGSSGAVCLFIWPSRVNSSVELLRWSFSSKARVHATDGALCPPLPRPQPGPAVHSTGVHASSIPRPSFSARLHCTIPETFHILVCRIPPQDARSCGQRAVRCAITGAKMCCAAWRGPTARLDSSSWVRGLEGRYYTPAGVT